MRQNEFAAHYHNNDNKIPGNYQKMFTQDIFNI